MKRLFAILISVVFIASCTKDVFDDGLYKPGVSDSVTNGSEGSGGQNPDAQAGVLTAGEWNDLENWAFWSALKQEKETYEYIGYWENNTDARVAVIVNDKLGKAVSNVSVKLFENGTSVWESVTDNHGRANLWTEQASAENLKLVVDGIEQSGLPQITVPSDDHVKYNTVTLSAPRDVANQVDIAFVVDATGSMGDEIDFLKKDLVDILSKAKAQTVGVSLRTAALFYRDEGDEYVTRHQDFSMDVNNTQAYIGKQKASGGGDYPEAVHTALEKTLQNLSWSNQARSRVVFMFLDAPAHHNDEVIASLKKSIAEFSKNGICIIPVAASGVDKPTEFMLRNFAILTGGTYTFLTDHSGVGNSHLKPTIGQFDVEKLNDLIVRLIVDRAEN